VALSALRGEAGASGAGKAAGEGAGSRTEAAAAAESPQAEAPLLLPLLRRFDRATASEAVWGRVLASAAERAETAELSLGCRLELPLLLRPSPSMVNCREAVEGAGEVPDAPSPSD
jgi:hypothetical protein